MQKAVYLAQVSGFDLGYRFNWYVRGPYCSAVADAYYSLAENPDKGEYTLSAQLKKEVAKAKTVVDNNPADVPQHRWLEAVASLDYMRRVRKVDDSALKETFETEKEWLKDLYDQARDAIRKLD